MHVGSGVSVGLEAGLQLSTERVAGKEQVRALWRGP